MPKIIFNETGFPIGTGKDGAKLSKEQWQEFLDNPRKRKWDGKSVVPYEFPFNAEACAQSIKSVASQLILAIAPEYKQRNYLAKAIEIADAKASGTATSEQLAISESIRSLWHNIEAIRAKSNELEQAYIALGKDLTSEDLETIKATLSGEQHD